MKKSISNMINQSILLNRVDLFYLIYFIIKMPVLIFICYIGLIGLFTLIGSSDLNIDYVDLLRPRNNWKLYFFIIVSFIGFKSYLFHGSTIDRFHDYKQKIMNILLKIKNIISYLYELKIKFCLKILIFILMFICSVQIIIGFLSIIIMIYSYIFSNI